MAAEMERLKMEQKRDAKIRQKIRESRFYRMFVCYAGHKITALRSFC